MARSGFALPLALVTLLVLAVNSTIAFAQVSAQPASFGILPFSTVSGGPDAISLANLGLSYDVPVFSRAGRGTPFSLGQTLQNASWGQGYNANGLTQWMPSFSPQGISGLLTNPSGIANGIGYEYYQITQEECEDNQGNPNQLLKFYYYTFGYFDGGGVNHPFGLTLSTLSSELYECADYIHQGSGTALASDGSGISLSASVASGLTEVITLRDGTVLNNLFPETGVGTSTDSNGNQITWNQTWNAGMLQSYTATDTLGTTVMSGSANSYTYTAPSGATAKFTVNVATYTVQTAFNCPGIEEFPATSYSLVSGFTLPDGSKYKVTYEPTTSGSGNVTGRIASVTLPTGGTISYTYTGGDEGTGIVCADGSTSGFNRTTPDGTWKYLRSNIVTSTTGNGCYMEGVNCVLSSTTTITDPQSNNTVINFASDLGYELLEILRKIYTGAATGTPLETVTTCYNGACKSKDDYTPVSEANILTSFNGGPQSRVDTFYNTYGLMTAKNEYDFGATTPTRQTTISYDTTIGNGVVDRPSLVSVTDGSGNFESQTAYTYDEDEVAGTIVASGASQLQTVTCTASSNKCRGNVTTLKNYVTASTYLTKTFVHYDSGAVYSATDSNSAVTSYTYGNCGNSFLTAKSLPLSLSESFTWYCGGAVESSATDENSSTSSAAYTTDAYFWRPNSSTDQASYLTTYAYTPTTTEGTLSFNGNQSTADSLKTLDGMGRPHVIQKRQGPGSTNFDTTEIDYGPLGVARQTMPYVGTAGQTNSSAPSTTTQYDGLGRKVSVTDAGGGTTAYTYNENDVLVAVGPAPTGENLKQRQYEYDGLGRLTSVCEITSVAGSGSCGQSNSETGFLTKYAYSLLGNLTVTQNAQPGAVGGTQTRTYTYDGLGRLTSEANPESGTKAYTYDTDSTCGTSNGDLVKKVDTANNVTCYAYDALHRVTGITYPSGPNSASTPSKTFVYDATTFSCTNPNGAFVKGRLAEAFTGPSTAKITDIGYCYSPRGEITDEFESTPNSNGYYHTTAAYWANGALNTLSGVPSRNAWTFGVDGEGRLYSAVDGSTTNLVTSATYNTASQPTGVSLGSGDSDTYTYDSNTGRMATYQFNIGSTPKMVVGTLGWNPNWSLGSLLITDAFDSADAQTCDYVHDDLSRLSSVSCGTTWGQTFSYDAFGNISKTGTIAFAASYLLANGTTNNQEQTVSSCVPTYDANGNLTTDCTFIPSYTYAWDSDANTVGINLTGTATPTINLTYDAFDRIVEENNAGTYMQVLYSPIGKLALMAKQVNKSVFLPLPGGEQATYSAGTIRFRHYDWQGSARFESTMGELIYGDVAYAPFGETYSSKDTEYLSFTGQQQDTIAGLYDFLYREYNPTQGRWISPDPSGLSAVDPSNPQSWNRYAYVGNSPLNRTDPNGLIYLGGHQFNLTPTQITCTTAAGPCGNSSLTCIRDGIETPCSGIARLQDEFALLGAQASYAAIYSAPSRVSYDYGVVNSGTFGGAICSGSCDGSDVADEIAYPIYGVTGETFSGGSSGDVVLMAQNQGTIQIPNSPGAMRALQTMKYLSDYGNRLGKYESCAAAQMGWDTAGGAASGLLAGTANKGLGLLLGYSSPPVAVVTTVATAGGAGKGVVDIAKNCTF
jgi:RHS repeat-associated protein